MSVIKAILFYSKRDQKSYRMKQVIDSVGADIDTVSVDSLEVRERLMEDEKYGINEVPAVLVLYSTGQHKTYTKQSLDSWFDQLLKNIQQYQMEQQAAMQEHAEAAMPPPPEPAYTQIDEGIPKPVRRKPTASTAEIPSSLPSPGRPQRTGSGDEVTTLIEMPEPEPSGIGGGGSGMTGGTQVAGIGGISSAQAAMISEHIKDAEPLIPITSDPHVQPGRKEVKKEGLSPADLAKQMAQQREAYEEKLEENRPFI